MPAQGDDVREDGDGSDIKATCLMGTRVGLLHLGKWRRLGRHGGSGSDVHMIEPGWESPVCFRSSQVAATRCDHLEMTGTAVGPSRVAATRNCVRPTIGVFFYYGPLWNWLTQSHG